MKSYEIYIMRSIIWNDGSVHSPIVLFQTGFRFNTDLFIFLFVGFTFEVIHYRVQDKKRLFQNEQQKNNNFERKTGVQEEKNSKYFEKLVIQVQSNFYSRSYYCRRSQTNWFHISREIQ